MKEIKLTRGYVALVDDEDFEELNQFKWVAFVNKCRAVYATCTPRIGDRGSDGRKKKVTFYMHRVLLQAVPGQIIDHVDHNGLNNQKSNLRFASQRENGRNTPKGRFAKSSIYKGVNWSTDKRQWRAHISRDRKYKHLGYFSTEVEAAIAYDRAAYALDPLYSVLNFTSGSAVQ